MTLSNAITALHSLGEKGGTLEEIPYPVGETQFTLTLALWELERLGMVHKDYVTKVYTLTKGETQ